MILPWVSGVRILTLAGVIGVAFMLNLTCAVGEATKLGAAATKEPPAELCTLLPTAAVERVMGQPFNPATKSPAAKGTGKEVTGSNCGYEPNKAGAVHSVTFIIYVDPSADVAKDSFETFKRMFGVSTTVSGVGDSAYLDSAHAIHVLKDKVRYFIQISPASGATTDKQVKDLANSVASQL